MTKIALTPSQYPLASAILPPLPLRFAAAPTQTSDYNQPPPFTPPPEPPRLPRLIDAASHILEGAWSALRGITLNIFDGLSGVSLGLLEVFSGDLGSGLSSLFRGLFATVVQTPLDALLSFGGHCAFGTMTALGMTPARRGLDAEERQQLKKMFGKSVDLDKVRIQEGPPWVFGATKAGAFVIGNTIHVPDKLPHNVLAHEVMHVLQHQNGGTDYLSESLWAQWTKPGHGYAYQVDLLKGAKFEGLSPEQQGKIVQDLFYHWHSIKDAERVFAKYSVRRDGLEKLESVEFGTATTETPPGFIDITSLVRDVARILR